MLLLTASMAMAQFGSLGDLIDNGTNNGTTTGDTNGNGKGKGGGFTGFGNRSSIIEKSIADGFFLIKQDFQLEDTTNGNRYNWEGGKEFGGSTSFMVKLADGYITTNSIVAPWDYDPNYPQFTGQKYKPVMLRTSTMKVNGEWKVQSEPMQLCQVRELKNGLKYVKVEVKETEDDDEEEENEETEENVEGKVSEGFTLATGEGKKEVWVIWLMATESEGETAAVEHCSYRLSQTEVTIEKGKFLYDMEAPGAAMKVMGGIVVEPIYTGIGHVDLALVGVIGQHEDKYQMALLNTAADDDDSTLSADDDSDKKSDRDRKSRKDRKDKKDKKDKKSSKKNKK